MREALNELRSLIHGVSFGVSKITIGGQTASEIGQEKSARSDPWSCRIMYTEKLILVHDGRREANATRSTKH